MFISSFDRKDIKTSLKKFFKEEKKNRNQKFNNITYIYNDLEKSKLLTVIDTFEKFTNEKMELIEIPINYSIFEIMKKENLNEENLEEKLLLSSIELIIDPQKLEQLENFRIIFNNINFLKKIITQNFNNKFILIFSYLSFHQFKDFLKFYDKDIYNLFINNLSIILDNNLNNQMNL